MIRHIESLLLALVSGVALIWLANRWLNPVPVSAAWCFAGGFLALAVGQGKNLQAVIGGVMGGFAIAVVQHGRWHASGQSPIPAEPVPHHLLVEGALGMGIALAALIPAWLVLAYFRRRAMNSDRA